MDITNENHKQRYAFDWDYTLNVYGGFKLINKSVKTMDDTLLVLLGGKERMENVRNILQFLISHNIKVYIITANPQAEENGNVHYIVTTINGKKVISHISNLFMLILIRHPNINSSMKLLQK